MNRAAAPDRGYLLKEALLFLGLSYLFLLCASSSQLLDFKLSLVSYGLFAVVSLAWLVWGRWVKPLAGPLLAWLACFLISACLSIDAGRSFDQLLLVCAGLTLFFLAAALAAHGWPLELWVKVFLLAAGLVLALQWVGVGLWYSRWRAAFAGEWLPDLIYRPPSANLVAVVCNWVWLLAAARLMNSRNWISRIFLGLLALASLGLFVLCSSRGAMLGAAAGLGVLVVIWGSQSTHIWRPWLTALRARRWVLILAGLAGLALALGAGGVLRYLLLHPSHGSALLARNEFWPPAWQAFLEHPWFGQGPFTYGSIYLRYNPVPPKQLFVHSHGSLFNSLAEMGLLGTAALLWGVGAALLALLRRARSANPADAAAALGILAAAVAWVTHSFVDCFHTEPLAFFPMLILAGAALGSGLPHQSLTARSTRPWWLVLVLAGAGYALWAQAPLQQALVFAQQQDLLSAETAFEQALRRFPLSTITRQQLGLTRGLLAVRGYPDRLPLAEQDLEAVRLKEPGWMANDLNLGTLYAASAETLPQAQRSFEQATVKAPDSALAWLNLGWACEQTGDASCARRAYARCFELDPEAASAAFFAQTDLRRELAAAVPAPVTDLAALRAEALPALTSRAPLRLALALISQGERVEAQTWLDRASFLYQLTPEDGLDLLWGRALLAEAQGDVQQAVTLGHPAVQGALSPGLNGPGSLGFISYGPLMFRRLTLLEEVLPQVQRVDWNGEWSARGQRLAGWLTLLGRTADADELREAIQVQIQKQQTVAP